MENTKDYPFPNGIFFLEIIINYLYYNIIWVYFLNLYLFIII